MKFLGKIFAFLFRWSLRIGNGLLVIVYTLSALFLLIPPKHATLDAEKVASILKNPLTWILLILFLASFLGRKLLVGFYNKRNMPYLLTGFVDATWFLFRVWMVTTWFSLSKMGVKYSIEGDMETHGLFLITQALFWLIAWLGYGKVIRDRGEIKFTKDILDLTKKKGGAIARKEEFAFLRETDLVQHAKFQRSHYRESESIPVAVTWPEPWQLFAIHKFRTITRNSQTKMDQDSVDWSFILCGKHRLLVGSLANDGIYTPAEFERQFEHTSDAKTWEELVQTWRIKKIEIHGEDYRILSKPTFSLIKLSLEYPEPEELDVFFHTVHQLLGNKI